MAVNSERAGAVRIAITGVVQGVGFRPFVYRLAQRLEVRGWVLNDARGVAIHAEADLPTLDYFIDMLRREAPAAASIAALTYEPEATHGCRRFEIRESHGAQSPTTRISPDLPVCESCLRELRERTDRRYRYPYINCTNCGPRYSIVLALPYDRPNTTMRGWPLCAPCAREYADPSDRRFHAQPVACPDCGPKFTLERSHEPAIAGDDALAEAVRLLRGGAIVAIKGIGGYHLACDARNATAVAALRARKFRKERPFAIMVRDAAKARELVVLDAESAKLLHGIARPIVLAKALVTLAGVAPDNAELGVMLPYTPMHHLLFDGGAPTALVMTSANRSSEPIAFRDEDARTMLDGIADALLVGERPIARRVDDSVVRAGPYGPTVLRRSRGLAPHVVATLPVSRPLLALGGDLKNAIALCIEGQVIVSQHIGDLEHVPAVEAFRETVAGLCAMYDLDPSDVEIVHDAHPQYRSTREADRLGGSKRRAVQHHRAHVASVLAERGAFDERVLGFGFDGTGYGDDGTIWGGEVFAGSIRAGFERVAHLRPVPLPGGDAAARFPVQAAAGFLADIAPNGMHDAPFDFPERYTLGQRMLERNVRSFTTSSIGRLFDAVAALCGFTREVTFEGQAAMWLEQIARGATEARGYRFVLDGDQFDPRELLAAVVTDRRAGYEPGTIALGFHLALADTIAALDKRFGIERVVVSGGVFQNALLLEALAARLGPRLWINRLVPANDGGICLGQLALAAHV
ncbi:MAG: carbamoyltransferase HypF [Candidatus Velthaea sp.]